MADDLLDTDAVAAPKTCAPAARMAVRAMSDAGEVARLARLAQRRTNTETRRAALLADLATKKGNLARTRADQANHLADCEVCIERQP